mgnify:CR=1 FL=1
MINVKDTNIACAILFYKGDYDKYDAYVFTNYSGADAYIIKHHEYFLSYVKDWMDDETFWKRDDYDRTIEYAKQNIANDRLGFTRFCEWYDVENEEDGTRIVDCDERFWENVAVGTYTLQLPE